MAASMWPPSAVPIHRLATRVLALMEVLARGGDPSQAAAESSTTTLPTFLARSIRETLLARLSCAGGAICTPNATSTESLGPSSLPCIAVVAADPLYSLEGIQRHHAARLLHHRLMQACTDATQRLRREHAASCAVMAAVQSEAARRQHADAIHAAAVAAIDKKRSALSVCLQQGAARRAVEDAAAAALVADEEAVAAFREAGARRRAQSALAQRRAALASYRVEEAAAEGRLASARRAAAEVVLPILAAQRAVAGERVAARLAGDAVYAAASRAAVEAAEQARIAEGEASLARLLSHLPYAESLRSIAETEGGGRVAAPTASFAAHALVSQAYAAFLAGAMPGGGGGDGAPLLHVRGQPDLLHAVSSPTSQRRGGSRGTTTTTTTIAGDRATSAAAAAAALRSLAASRIQETGLFGQGGRGYSDAAVTSHPAYRASTALRDARLTNPRGAQEALTRQLVHAAAAAVKGGAGAPYRGAVAALSQLTRE